MSQEEQTELKVYFEDVKNESAYNLLKSMLKKISELERKLSATDTAVYTLKREVQMLKDNIPTNKVRR